MADTMREMIWWWQIFRKEIPNEGSNDMIKNYIGMEDNRNWKYHAHLFIVRFECHSVLQIHMKHDTLQWTVHAFQMWRYCFTMPRTTVTLGHCLKVQPSRAHCVQLIACYLLNRCEHTVSTEHRQRWKQTLEIPFPCLKPSETENWK